MTTTTWTFSYTGSLDTFIVPFHTPGTLTIHAHGGTGGNTDHVGAQYGGGGGCIKVDGTLAPGTVLTIAVGGSGAYVPAGQASGGTPGTNPLGDYDGGAGGPGSSLGGAGGGAATVVLAGGVPILVAAGGGGAACGTFGNGRSGGWGGYNGVFGTSGTWYGSRIPGAGQTAFNAGNGWGATLAAAGQGGIGNTGYPGLVGSSGSGHVGGAAYGSSVGTRGAGGGGGGYYGGGGGGGASNQAGVGAGGSTWYDTAVGASPTSPDFSTGSGTPRVAITADYLGDWVPPGGWSVGFLKF